MSTMYSIFKSAAGEAAFAEAYDRNLALWTVPYETSFVQTEFGDTHVIASGPKDGEPVVLLHGMTGNSTFWMENIPAMSGFRTYCIDAMGDLGRSVVRRPLKSREDCARWLEQVLNGLGLQRASLVGHSMGGWLSLNFSVAKPERVDKLVLLAPVASFASLPLAMMTRIYPAMLWPTRERVTKAWSWFLAPGQRIHPTVMDGICTAYAHCRPQLAAIPGRYSAAELARLTMPVLFLVGDAEKIYNPVKVMGRVKAAIPHASTQLIRGAGHCLITEQADAVNAAIADFLHGGT